MKAIHLYRAFLYLYPADFRTHFSDEMKTVFEQTLRDHPANKPTLLAKEFFSIVKGASIMWLSKIQPIPPSASINTNHPLTMAELTNLRDAAIRNMCAAIATHDFYNARRYSDEEARLKHLLIQVQKGTDALSA